MDPDYTETWGWGRKHQGHVKHHVKLLTDARRKSSEHLLLDVKRCIMGDILICPLEVWKLKAKHETSKLETQQQIQAQSVPVWNKVQTNKVGSVDLNEPIDAWTHSGCAENRSGNCTRSLKHNGKCRRQIQEFDPRRANRLTTVPLDCVCSLNETLWKWT